MDLTIPRDRLAAVRAAVSPRSNRQPASPAGIAIHAGALLLWCGLVVRAFFGGGGVFSWSAGIVYILYDTALLGFVFARTFRLRGPVRDDAAGNAPPPDATVIVAARNEAASLPVTIAALLAQSAPAATVVIADDGSSDATGNVLERVYGLRAAPFGTLSAPSPVHPAVRWLRLPPGGKARALNAACALATTELVLTVDADTLLDPPALAAMGRAFAADPALVAATGVLTPRCRPTAQGRVLQWFQTYEYVRNFLSRYAWMRADGLLLISGAFGCYRRAALLAVGGFDPDCLVEDYELVHRLRDAAGRNGAPCHTAVIGGAHGHTDAPGTFGGFLRQRRRWFGGFLQTQLWYRHMVGNRLYGNTGTAMLPVKAIDTLQPLYGLAGTALLLADAVSGRVSLLEAIGTVIGAKLAIDLAFGLWSMRLYRRWVGDAAALSRPAGLLAILLEPFSFQILRHLGAALGWVTFLTGAGTWAASDRREIFSERGAAAPVPRPEI